MANTNEKGKGIPLSKKTKEKISESLKGKSKFKPLGKTWK